MLTSGTGWIAPSRLQVEASRAFSVPGGSLRPELVTVQSMNPRIDGGLGCGTRECAPCAAKRRGTALDGGMGMGIGRSPESMNGLLGLHGVAEDIAARMQIESGVPSEELDGAADLVEQAVFQMQPFMSVGGGWVFNKPDVLDALDNYARSFHAKWPSFAATLTGTAGAIRAITGTGPLGYAGSPELERFRLRLGMLEEVGAALRFRAATGQIGGILPKDQARVQALQAERAVIQTNEAARGAPVDPCKDVLEWLSDPSGTASRCSPSWLKYAGIAVALIVVRGLVR